MEAKRLGWAMLYRACFGVFKTCNALERPRTRFMLVNAAPAGARYRKRALPYWVGVQYF